MSGMTTASETEVKSDFLSQAIGLSYELLGDILFHITHIEPFDTKNPAIWNHHFAQITSDISQFVEITTLCSKVMMRNKKHEIPTVKESHIHLLFIVKAINQAQLKQDPVALDDLIKYELKDNLTQWKIDLIPQMKRLLNA